MAADEPAHPSVHIDNRCTLSAAPCPAADYNRTCLRPEASPVHQGAAPSACTARPLSAACSSAPASIDTARDLRRHVVQVLLPLILLLLEHCLDSRIFFRISRSHRRTLVLRLFPVEPLRQAPKRAANAAQSPILLREQRIPGVRFYTVVACERLARGGTDDIILCVASSFDG